eukprot:scaffold395392_cov15-Prasinocladus_malaysianus.AAC.1
MQREPRPSQRPAADSRSLSCRPTAHNSHAPAYFLFRLRTIFGLFIDGRSQARLSRTREMPVAGIAAGD